MNTLKNTLLVAALSQFTNLSCKKEQSPSNTKVTLEPTSMTTGSMVTAVDSTGINSINFFSDQIQRWVHLEENDTGNPVILDIKSQDILKVTPSPVCTSIMIASATKPSDRTAALFYYNRNKNLTKVTFKSKESWGVPFLQFNHANGFNPMSQMPRITQPVRMQIVD